ncbi:MAG: glycosyltransferase [Deltaproteobacteria bacterium]|nr:glycosyltransferase [Deltaproteobacteria bacterium]
MVFSIVIPLYNNLSYTEKCLQSILFHTPNKPQFEIVLIDNGSSDGTGEYLKAFADNHPHAVFQVISNAENLGFARACNQGARQAGGAFLVFLNNDTVVHDAWSNALLDELSFQPETGIVGARLLNADGTIQHAGVAIGGNRIPYHVHRGIEKDHSLVSERRRFRIVTGACMAVRREQFLHLGGFDEAFINGHEDVDLCLRYDAAGWHVVYRPDCVVTHFEESSEGRLDYCQANTKRTFLKWGRTLCQDDFNYQFPESERQEATQPLAFALKICAPDLKRYDWGDLFFAQGLAKALCKRGHRCRIDYMNEWGNRDTDIDVVVHIAGLSRYYPKSYNFNILWLVSHPSRITSQELASYDLVLVASKKFLPKVKAMTHTPVHVFLQASDVEHFYPDPEKEKDLDLVFVGNNIGTGRLKMRRVVAEALKLGRRLAVWGKGWKGILPDDVWQGEFIPWQKLPDTYRKAKIVLNDHHPDMLCNGFVNNRTFDVLACGAQLMTDSLSGLEEELGYVPVFSDTKPLKPVLSELEFRNAKERQDISDKFRQIVCDRFSFDVRAGELLEIAKQNGFSLPNLKKACSAAKGTVTDGPLVSVLMSTYNRRHLLPIAVRSVLSQTYRNLELIVVNDGGESAEESIESIGDNRIRYINAPHVSKGHALNTGFAHSRGEYIAYLDDDDIWYPKHLEALMFFLRNVPDVRFAYTDALLVTNQIGQNYSDTPNTFKELVYCRQVFLPQLLESNSIPGIVAAHDRHAFEEIGGFDPKLQVLVDFDFFRRLAAITDPYHIAQTTAEYSKRHHRGTSGQGHMTNLHKTDRPRYLANHYRIVRKKLPLNQNPDTAEVLHEVQKKIGCMFLNARGEKFLAEENHIRAAASFRLAAKISFKEMRKCQRF